MRKILNTIPILRGPGAGWGGAPADLHNHIQPYSALFTTDLFTTNMVVTSPQSSARARGSGMSARPSNEVEREDFSHLANPGVAVQHLLKMKARGEKKLFYYDSRVPGGADHSTIFQYYCQYLEVLGAIPQYQYLEVSKSIFLHTLIQALASCARGGYCQLRTSALMLP